MTHFSYVAHHIHCLPGLWGYDFAIQALFRFHQQASGETVFFILNVIFDEIHPAASLDYGHHIFQPVVYTHQRTSVKAALNPHFTD